MAPMIKFEGEDLLRLAPLARHEWLESNGLGGYAASTMAMCHARKYHGLLVARLANPPGKFVMLAKLEATLGVADEWVELGVNYFPGTVHPQGHTHLLEVSHDLWLREHFGAAGCELWRETLMPRGEDTVLQRFSLPRAPGPVILRLTPLLNPRDHHALGRANPCLRTAGEWRAGCLCLHPYDGLPPLYLSASHAATYQPAPCWWYNLEFPRERERGFDHHEDLFAPGQLTLTLLPGETGVVRASLAPPAGDPTVAWDAEARRREAVEASFMASPPPLRLLQTHAEQYLVTTPRGEASVVAGYPWFGEWGRDTMIALPGLAVACGRLDTARATLASWAAYERDGLLPNYLGNGAQTPAYNSLDAGLWYLRALADYLRASGAWRDAGRDLLPVAERLIRAFVEGRAPHARLTADGLIYAGSPDTQLTWMDARVHGRPVTPRHGLAIEINALWYHGLELLAAWYRQRRQRPPAWLSELRLSVAQALPARFWLDSEGGYLADTVTEDGPDPSIRPNQIFAVALPHSALDSDQQRAVVACVRRHLLTPYGLRTLAPGHPDYQVTYRGSGEQRDAAYHQGTVWPWLIGAFVDAELRVADDPAQRARELRHLLAPLCERQPVEYGIHGIAEVFDGDSPHLPGGCPHQAWSAGEVIRASLRLLQLAPS